MIAYVFMVFAIVLVARYFYEKVRDDGKEGR